jgi:PAP2 superfamily
LIRLAPVIATLVLTLTLAIDAGPAATSAHARPGSVVTPWIELELDAIAAQRVNPPRAARALAHLSSAMHLAALSGESGRDDAVAGAASVVVFHLHPETAARVDALVAELADPESRAFARGRLIGRLVVARARNDGSDRTWTGSPPTGDQYWVPTPPANAYPPLEPLAGAWVPWNLRDGAQFRPGPPPAYGSREFLAEMDEVWSVSQNLTDEQRRIASFWADGSGTVTPPGHWNQIATGMLASDGRSTLGTARVFAALNTAQEDAFIAAWDAKYAYWSLRPVTAIRRLIDPNWLPFIVTPPFPSYVSGHATTSGAAATVLESFFPESAAELDRMAEAAALSRLYGGIHFRSDNETGLALGRKVGSAALQVYR